MYRCIFNHFYVIRPQGYRIRRNNANYRSLRRSRSFKVNDFGTDGKHICDFLLVINSNLPPILRRFQVMADYWWTFRYRSGCFTLTPPLGVIPCKYPDKLYLSRNYRDCPTRCWKPHDRIFIRLNTIPERDGQTDGIPLCRALYTVPMYSIQRSALRAMWTRCKNERLGCTSRVRTPLTQYTRWLRFVEDEITQLK